MKFDGNVHTHLIHIQTRNGEVEVDVTLSHVANVQSETIVGERIHKELNRKQLLK